MPNVDYRKTLGIRKGHWPKTKIGRNLPLQSPMQKDIGAN